MRISHSAHHRSEIYVTSKFNSDCTDWIDHFVHRDIRFDIFPGICKHLFYMETKSDINWIFLQPSGLYVFLIPISPRKKKDNQAFLPVISCSTFLSANCTAILS